MNFLSGRSPVRRIAQMLPVLLLLSLIAPLGAVRAEETLSLDALVAEGLQNSPEILAARARAQAAGYRIPQARSLPDPMFMFGYQNEGFERLTIGEVENAMGMSSISQMFYFPGKRKIKGEMATKDAMSVAAMYDETRLRVVSKIKQLYYDLFLAYKTVDILKERAELYARIEDAAATRYSSGMGSQQEVVMAQTEKYMLLEKEEMQKQKIQAFQGMINSTAGRDVNSPLGRPVLTGPTPFDVTLEKALAAARDHSPEIRSKQKMVEGAEARVKMAQKEYYPDFTLGASYLPRTQGLPDMWNLTMTVNLPIYYRSKQRQAVAEARAGTSEAKQDVTATQLMVAANVRDSYSMLSAADRLMKLYREGLVPKANQDVQLALSGYVSGKIEALTAITRIQRLLDYDLLYWNQLVEREKAIVRLHAVAGGLDGQPPMESETGGPKKTGTAQGEGK